jgi:hypothetical protein
VQVFGGKDGRFRLDWLLPRPAHFPASIVADLLGYTIQVQASQRDRLKGGEQSVEERA